MNVKRSPYKELDMENLIQDKYVKNGATGDDRFFEEKLKKALFESRDCTQMEFLKLRFGLISTCMMMFLTTTLRS